MSNNRAARAAASLLVLTLLAAGCGKKGPLYLPDEASSAPRSTASVAPVPAPAPR